MRYTVKNDFLEITADEFGAVLTSVRSVNSNFEFLWQANPAVWNGQSPILFPNIGKLLDDKYRLNGKEYSIQRHGFARHRTFSLETGEENSLTFLQEDDAETFACYPYHYKLYIKFAIRENRLTVTHTVVNENDTDMYFSIGAHPAFNCEIGDKLVFEKTETLESERIDASAVIIDEKIPVLNNEDTLTITKHLFDDDALIFSGLKSEFVTLCSQSSDRKIKFTFGKAPFLAIWAKPNAPYVCIEPWHGVNDSYDKKDDLSQKRGIEHLAAGESFSFSWTAEFSE